MTGAQYSELYNNISVSLSLLHHRQYWVRHCSISSVAALHTRLFGFLNRTSSLGSPFLRLPSRLS